MNIEIKKDLTSNWFKTLQESICHSISSLEKNLIRATNFVKNTGGGILVISEGVFGMRGEQGKLKEIVTLKKEYNFRFLVDDAHGFGTLGEKGARVFTKDEVFFVNAIQPIKENDPTGCGDAFRAGLLCGFNLKHNIQKAVMFGNAMGCVKVEKDGAQNHRISLRELQKMVEKNYT